jgi:dTDP-4-amino-4,6-dideoxygalactose transaminase
VIPVHFAGQSCDMRKIHSLSKEYGFKIIEDASHAIGGKYLDKPVGGCQYSDITVFSFPPVKIITTAEGDWYYQQIVLGFNYRMTELQAALGVSQMQKLDEFVTQRHTLQERYDSLLSSLPIVKPYQNRDSYSALHLYPIQINLNSVDKGREKIFEELRQSDIGVNVHYIPIHTQPYYRQFGFGDGDFPVSEDYYSKVISLPIYYGMTFSEQDLVVNKLENILRE